MTTDFINNEHSWVFLGKCIKTPEIFMTILHNYINLRLPINCCMNHTHLSIMHITHSLCKWNTIWIHSSGHQQTPVTSKHVYKTSIKKIQILKFKGMSIQTALATCTTENRLQVPTLTHKCIQGQAPKYLQDLIAIRKHDRNLRSNDAGLILN